MASAPQRNDPVATAFKRNPFPTLFALPREGPLVRARLPLIGECWLVVTHEAVGSVLKDPACFVVDGKNAARAAARCPARRASLHATTRLARTPRAGGRRWLSNAR